MRARPNVISKIDRGIGKKEPNVSTLKSQRSTTWARDPRRQLDECTVWSPS